MSVNFKDLLKESLRKSFGGLPTSGGFEPWSEYHIGLGKYVEAVHCILGSLKRTVDLYENSGDLEKAIESELSHIDEEITVIEDTLEEYSRDIYIEILNRKGEENFKKIVKTSKELKKRCVSMKKNVKKEEHPKPIEKMAFSSYNALITLCEVVIENHGDFEYPTSESDNVFSNSKVEDSLKNLKKKYKEYKNFN